MTNESHTDWWNQYLKSDDPDHVVVQMDKEIELLRDQRDSNMAKEVERIASLTTQRDEYKIWWERDSTSLGKALNEVSSLRAVREESRAVIEQLHAAVKTAQELAATRLMEIERLKAAMKGWSSYAWKDKCYVDDVQEYFDSVLKGVAPTSLDGIEVFDEELGKSA